MAKQSFVLNGLHDENVAQVIECLPTHAQTWVPSPAAHNMAVQSYNPNTQESEVGGSEAQDHP